MYPAKKEPEVFGTGHYGIFQIEFGHVWTNLG